jgi:hypothetical protein
MIVEKNFKVSDKSTRFPVLGVGVLKFLNTHFLDQVEILFQMGIGSSLLQKIFNIHKKKIREKGEGFLIDLISDFTVYIHFFKVSKEEISIIIYLDQKGNIISFSHLFAISKRIYQFLKKRKNKNNIKNFCQKLLKIPHTEGILALLIIGTSGHLYFSKIDTNKTKFAECEDLISGFITAILTFSKEIIENEPGTKLKQINFGKQHFLVNCVDQVIFAYLIEEEGKDKLDRRYMHLISEEFFDRYRDYIKDFKGNTAVFFDFEEVIDQYFLI